jgi:hypothetical protein
MRAVPHPDKAQLRLYFGRMIARLFAFVRQSAQIGRGMLIDTAQGWRCPWKAGACRHFRIFSNYIAVVR